LGIPNGTPTTINPYYLYHPKTPRRIIAYLEFQLRGQHRDTASSLMAFSGVLDKVVEDVVDAVGGFLLSDDDFD